jgi:ketosteroid isomerase-like protein
MSQENVEVVRRFYESARTEARRGTLAVLEVGLVEFIAPEFEFFPTRELDAAGLYRGPDGFSRFLAEFFGEFDDVRIEPHEFIEAGDQVLVALTFYARGKQSGAEAAWNVFTAWTLSDGMITRGQTFADRADALKAVGLAE